LPCSESPDPSGSLAHLFGFPLDKGGGDYNSIVSLLAAELAEERVDIKGQKEWISND
jgi:hypothetical protein